MNSLFRSTLAARAVAPALAGLLATGCTQKKEAAAPAPEVLAEVGAGFVSEASFRHAWEEGQRAEDTPAARDEVLDRLIERTALAEAAKRAGLADDPVVIEQVQRLLAGRLREVKLAPALAEVEVCDEEILARYQSQAEERFRLPAQIRAAVLWFDTRGQEPLVERYRPRLEAVRSQLQEDSGSIPVAEGFGPLATSQSEHRTTKFKGGDTGWLTAGRSMDAVNSAVAAIAADLNEPGDLSPVVARPDGLFLVRLIERRDEHVQDLAEVRERIRDELRREKRSELGVRFRDEVLGSFDIVRHADRLAAIEDLPLSAPQAPPFSPPTLSHHQDQ